MRVQANLRWARPLMTGMIAAGLAACGGGGDVSTPTAATPLATASTDGSAPRTPAAPAAGGVAATEKFLDFQSSATVAKAFAAGNLTLDAGIVKIGDRFFVSDHASGFCPLEIKGGDKLHTIRDADCITAAVSPGQSAQQRLSDGSYFAYIADNSARGVSIYRVRLDNNGRLDPTYAVEALAPTLDNGPAAFWSDKPRVTAIAFGPDGHLYAVFGRNNAVVQIQNPHGLRNFDSNGLPIPPSSNYDLQAPTAKIVGRTIDKVGPPSIAFVNDDLYLAEAAGVSVIKSLANQPAGAPEKVAVSLHPTYINVPAPMVVAATDGRNLYVGDSENVYRYDTKGLPGMGGTCNSFTDPKTGQVVTREVIDPNTQALIDAGRLEILAKGGTDGHDFNNIVGIGISGGTDRPTELMIADDRTLGDVFNEGRVFRVEDAANAPADRPAVDCSESQAAPPVQVPDGKVRGTELGGVNYGTPANPFTDLTSPSAILQLGDTTWVVDHVQGLCRVDKMATALDRASYCSLGAASPGGAVYDAKRKRVYVADMSSGRGAVVRFTYDEASGKVVNPVRLTNTNFTNNLPQALTLKVTNANTGDTDRLYVALRKNGAIHEVMNPDTQSGNAIAAPQVGRIAKKVPASMAFAGTTLYLAEPAGITKMDFSTCRTPCTAVSAGLPFAAPAFIASHGQLVDKSSGKRINSYSGTSHFLLYVAEGNFVHRYFVPEFRVQIGEAQTNYATEAVQQSAGPDVKVPLQFVGAIGIDASKPVTSEEPQAGDRVFTSDDPSNGANNRARIWELEKD